MAFNDFLQVVKMVVIVARSSEYFERQVSDDGRRAVIQE